MPQMRISKTIPGFYKSYARLAPASVDTAVVFVHGFGGSPTGTWRFFHNLVDEYSTDYPWWTRSDLIFYSYESRKTPIGKNAQRLGEFLSFVLDSGVSRKIGVADVFPLKNDKTETLEWGQADYKNLVLVGHSEGAVLIRRLILDRFLAIKKDATAHAAETGKTREQYVDDASKLDVILNGRLRLFAPACLGTNFSALVGFATSLSSLVAAIGASSLVRNELLAGSPILNAIECGTKDAFNSLGRMNGLAARNLFGVPDQIVYAKGYDEIDETEYEEGKDHFTICKPSYVYKRPLTFVST